MVTKFGTYIRDENGDLVYLAAGSELTDHVLSQVSNTDITGLAVTEEASSTEEEAEEETTPARSRRTTSKK